MSIEQDARAAADKRYENRGEAPLQAGGVRNARSQAFEKGHIAGASRPVTDEQADAAQVAFHDYCFGPDEPLTARDIGVTRQAWKVAIEAARKEQE